MKMNDKMSEKMHVKKQMSYLNEGGSASILLVIIMVTLLSLGVLSVVSSYSNYKIASRNADWNAVYYEEDAFTKRNYMKLPS